MTTEQLLSHLRQLGVRVWVQDHRLRVGMEFNRLPPELREEVVARKAGILALLGEETAWVPGEILPVSGRNGQEPLPASFAQEGLWLLHQLEPETTAYSLPAAYRLAGRLDVASLERACAEIVRRHEVLRSALGMRGGRLCQTSVAAPAPCLAVLDWSPVAGGPRPAGWGPCVTSFLRKCFDLSAGPLFHFELLRLSPVDHLLLLNFHHSVSDGWSQGIFTSELARLYEDFSGGRPSSLPPLALQYADYAAWQRQHLEGAELDRHLDYWREELAGAPPAQLPPDHLRPVRVGYSGAQHSFDLAPELIARVRAFAQAEGATPFMVLLGVFQALLCRLTGQTDLVIGSPVANRPKVELEGIIGLFVNMLPLRLDGSGEPGFRELVARIKQKALAAQDHAEVPFEKLVSELNPARDLGHHPFFDICFAVQNTPDQPLALTGLQVAPHALFDGTTRFDLELHFWDRGGHWCGQWFYRTDLFREGTIQRLAGHYGTLATHLLDDPDRPVSQVPLLTQAGHHQVVVDWNQTATPYPRDSCVHELFEAAAGLTPDAVALEVGGERRTYRELNASANRLARRLKQHGVGPETPVAVCLPRSEELVISLLAVLKTGGAYVPLDADYPPERLAFMLRDSTAPVLLTRSELLPRLPAHGVEVICLDADWPALGTEGGDTPATVTRAEGLAYIMYTSGSTGVPKGVAVPHRAITRLVLQTNYIRFLPTDRVAMVSNVSFDAATMEIWGALLNGAVLVMFDRDTILSPQVFARELRERRVSVMFLTTALFNQVASQAPGAFAGLRVLITGGEAMSKKWVQAVLDDRPPRRLLNAYGPTENTTFTCCHEIVDVPLGAASVPIGRPIANTRVYILGEHLDPVAIGIPGELYTAGDGLARGYWNRRELTAARFIPDPFQPGPGSRMYRTGDICRWLPDGSIEWLGRTDHQIKLRGYRIELGEIETALARHPGVRDAVVTVEGDPAGERFLIAHLTAVGSARPAAEDLRTHLKHDLPGYMIPSAFRFLDRLPLSPNGKVDRSALPAPRASASPAPGPGSAAPMQTLLVEELRGIWQRLFNRSDIGPDDNFFDLGGHSLMAARLAHEVEALVGRPLPVASVFQAPTILAMAEMLSDQQWAPAWSSLVAIQPHGHRPPLFCLHGNEGDVFGWAKLAPLLEPDRPVFGLQAVGVDGKAPCHQSFEEMAAHYVREMRSRQPQGPYYLIGHCAGGVLAYEVAQQLAAQGAPVGLLVLFDSFPERLPRLLWWLVTPQIFARRWWHRLVSMLVDGASRRRYWRIVASRVGLAERLPARDPVDEFGLLETAKSPVERNMMYHFLKAFRAYEARSCQFPVLLLQSTGYGAPEWSRIWRWLAVGPRWFHRLPFSHVDYFQPANLPQVATVLLQHLNRNEPEPVAVGRRTLGVPQPRVADATLPAIPPGSVPSSARPDPTLSGALPEG